MAVPVRTCVGCGARDAQSAMLRVQLGAAGGPTLVERAGHGRSAYVHARPACAAALPKSRGLARSLRTPVGQTERAGLRICIEDRIRRAQLQAAAAAHVQGGE